MSSSQRGTLLGITPIIITWALWKARCEARMEEHTITWQKTTCQIKSMLAQVGNQITKARKTTAHDMQILRALNYLISIPRQWKVQLISWEKPLGIQLKLNVDGASKGNPGPSGGGGLLRDSLGTCWAGLAHHYGVCTNMMAETRALLDGLCLYRDVGVVNIMVETDSKVIAEWANKGTCSLWWLWDFWEDIIELI